MKQDRRGSWYLLTGAIIGIATGLIYSWAISPVEYVDAPPYALSASFKDEYRVLVAQAYLYNGDLVRASNRLAQLKDENITQNLALQAQQAMAEGRPEEEIKALGILTMALAQQKAPLTSPVAPTQTATTISPSNAITPTILGDVPEPNQLTLPQGSVAQENLTIPVEPTMMVQPVSTATSTLVPGTGFVLADTTLICNPDQSQPMLQVQVSDAAGQPVGSVEFIVTWDGGEDHFFTGLRPEQGIGYADYVMTPEVTYSFALAGSGIVVNDLSTAGCLSDDQLQYWGSWQLTFVQP